MSAGKDFSVKITVRNAHLLRAIRKNHDSLADFCRASGVSQTALSGILTFRLSAFKGDGSLTKAAEDICSYLGEYPGDLWPKEVARIKLKKSTAEVEISSAEMMAICGNSEASVIQRDLLSRWSAKLSPREIEAIGIVNGGGTLDDGGSALGVSRERFRQIYCNGLRKMRNAAHFDSIRSISDISA